MFRGLIAMLVAGGIVFPLVGVSLVVMLALDWIYMRVRKKGGRRPRRMPA